MFCVVVILSQLENDFKTKEENTARRMKNMDNKKLVTTKEMAEILNVHENTLFNWAKEGMPRYKLGSNAVRYDIEEVLEWVRTRGERK